MSSDKNFLDESGLSTLVTQLQARFALLRKGLPGGIAELNASGKVPAAQVEADSTLSTLSTNAIQNAPVATEFNSLRQALNDEAVTRSTLGAHNLARITVSSTTVNGVTFTVNNDGTITANGTATANADFYPCGTSMPILVDGETYILSGCADGGSSSTYKMQVSKSSSDINVVELYNSTTEKSFTVDYSSTTVYRIRIRVYSGKTISNGIFKPMIRLASDSDTTFRPYVPTNSQILSHADNGIIGAKNFLNLKLADVKTRTSGGSWSDNVYTNNGVTYTVATDSNDNVTSITVNGTAPASTDSTMRFKTQTNLPIGLYRLVGCPKNDGSSYQYITNVTATGSVSDTGNGVVVRVTDATHNYTNVITVRKTRTANNLKYVPMILLASDTDTTFQPYAMTNQQLTDVATQVQNRYVYCGMKSVSVTSDGVKTNQAISQELITAFNTYLTNNPQYYARISNLRRGTNYYRPETGSATYNLFSSATNASSLSFSRFLVSTTNSYSWSYITLSTTLANNKNFNMNNGESMNDTSTSVISSGNVYSLYFDAYYKIS